MNLKEKKKKKKNVRTSKREKESFFFFLSSFYFFTRQLAVSCPPSTMFPFRKSISPADANYPISMLKLITRARKRRGKRKRKKASEKKTKSKKKKGRELRMSRRLWIKLFRQGFVVLRDGEVRTFPAAYENTCILIALDEKNYCF